MVSCLRQEKEGAARTLPRSLGAREPLKRLLLEGGVLECCLKITQRWAKWVGGRAEQEIQKAQAGGRARLEQLSPFSFSGTPPRGPVTSQG